MYIFETSVFVQDEERSVRTELGNERELEIANALELAYGGYLSHVQIVAEAKRLASHQANTPNKQFVTFVKQQPHAGGKAEEQDESARDYQNAE